MEENLTSLLLANSALTALIGQRLTWNTRQQGAAVPAVILTVVSNIPDYTHDGETIGTHRVQIDCWAKTFSSAVAVGRAVDAALSGYKGGSFQGIFKDAERQSFETGAEAAERFYRVSLDYMIWHN